jgi:hypothetical protein
MKYFEKIPKFTYETTIGSFTISYPYSYYEFNYDSIRIQDYSCDNKSTLLEAAAIVYGDPNSIWAFLLSNQTINPFALLATNVEIFQKDNQNKLSIGMLPPGGSSLADNIKPKSIIVESKANSSADPANFGSTGGFDLDGNFTIVEAQNTYDKKIKIKPIKQVNPNDNWNISAISADQLKTFTFNKIEGYEKSTYTYSTSNKILYTKEESFSEVKQDSKIFQAKLENIETSFAPNSIDYNQEKNIILENKNIKSFLPSELNKVLANLTTVKYS